MKSSTNLAEAVLVFSTLTTIALLNMGQVWEGKEMSEHYLNMELTYMLQLSEDQIDQIRSINAVYEIDLSSLKNEAASNNAKAAQLLSDRNQRILEVLTEEQQEILHEYCTHLISYTKMSY